VRPKRVPYETSDGNAFFHAADQFLARPERGVEQAFGQAFDHAVDHAVDGFHLPELPVFLLVEAGCRHAPPTARWAASRWVDHESDGLAVETDVGQKASKTCWSSHILCCRPPDAGWQRFFYRAG
jgi:hypothetical protein